MKIAPSSTIHILITGLYDKPLMRIIWFYKTGVEGVVGENRY